MELHRKIVKDTTELDNRPKDKDKITYLFFQRLFSIEEIEHYFKGKYTYKEVRNIIRGKRQEYYDKERKNGR